MSQEKELFREMCDFIKELKENFLEPGLLIEKVEADWIDIMTPLVEFLLTHTPALVEALAQTIIVEGYGEGGGEINPKARLFVDSNTALKRFRDTWAWVVRAHEYRSIESRLKKAATILEKIEKSREGEE